MTPEVVVVFVPGTRPRVLGRELFSPPNWTNEGSAFRIRLAAALPPDAAFEEFLWDGANTHAARVSAGERLAAKLRQIRSDHPAARLVVVAHSHGGNVAVYAMRQFETSPGLVPPTVDALVCLGTPFFRATLRDLDVVFRRLWISIYYGIFLAILVAFVTLGPLLQSLSIQVARAFLLVMVAAFIGWRLFGIRVMTRWMASGRVAALAPRARELARRVDSTPPAHGPKLLIVKSARDEAKLWLTLADRTASLSSGEGWLRLTSRLLFAAVRALDWLQAHRAWTVVPAAALLGLILAQVDETGWKPVQLKGLILLPFVMLVGLTILHAVVFVATAFTVRGSTMTFGQTLFLSLVATVSASDAPLTNGSAVYDELRVTLPRNSFHHGAFYVDAQVVDKVAAWIADRLAAVRR